MNILKSPLILFIICTNNFLLAKSIVVNSLIEEDSSNSIYNAYDSACSGDTIRFAPELNSQVIELYNGPIVINKDLTIIGNDTSNTIIDGLNSNRVLILFGNISVKIEGVKFQNGISSSAGGAIVNYSVLF